MRLTETNLKTLRPRTSSYRIFEKGSTRGFGVQVNPSGSVSYFLCFVYEGKTKYKTLGVYPSLSLETARKLAADLRVEIDSGGFGAPKQAVGTLKDLCDMYVAHLQTNGKDSRHNVKRILYHDVLSVLDGSRLANTITPADIRTVIYKCVERGAGVMGNRVRSTLKAAFTAGMKHDYDPRIVNTSIVFNLTANPVNVVPRMTDLEIPGERVLTLEELTVAFNNSVMPRANNLIIQLLILFCGQRPSEVANARWEEFDFKQNIWSIPPARIKNRRWHVLPLTPLILTKLEYARELARSDVLVFPGRCSPETKRHENTLYSSVTSMNNLLGLAAWNPSDLRRTCKTLSGAAGLSKEIRDRLQNHALNDVSSKHYDRHLYLKDKYEALLLWEQYLRDNKVIL